jgi:ribonuclease P protein component
MLRLKSATDFERVRRDGRSHAHPLAVLIACATGQATRWGFAAGRSVGGAVQRNRAKRLLREAARAQADQAAAGWDLVFIARKPLAAASLGEAQAVVSALLRRAKVLAGQNV